MAWTTPMTATAGQVLTAALWNTHIRDNFNETCPAKATTAGSIFVATGANAIAERIISAATVATAQTTSSTSYTDLATVGPAVTVTTGTQAVVLFATKLNNATNGNASHASVAVSGASTVAANDAWRIQSELSTSSVDDMRISGFHLFTGLTAGSNTFTMKYKSGAATAAGFQDREILVIPL